MRSQDPPGLPLEPQVQYRFCTANFRNQNGSREPGASVQIPHSLSGPVSGLDGNERGRTLIGMTIDPTVLQLIDDQIDQLERVRALLADEDETPRAVRRIAAPKQAPEKTAKKAARKKATTAKGTAKGTAKKAGRKKSTGRAATQAAPKHVSTTRAVSRNAEPRVVRSRVKKTEQ